jgi:transcriptional regulator with PAS, ATPase and Fis domain/tetratricopeptide (TPR) repeat protein
LADPDPELNNLVAQLPLLSGECRASREAEIAERLMARGDYRLALSHLAGAQRDSADPGLRERLDLLAGVARLRRGELERAERHLQHYLEVVRQRDDRAAEARALAHLGEIFRRRGEVAAASHALEQARSHFESQAGGELLVAIYTSLTGLALAAGQLDRAEALAARALELAQEVGSASAEAAALLTAAELHRRRADLSGARLAMSRAVELFGAAGLPRELAEAQLAYGELIGSAADAFPGEQAAPFIARAEALFLEHGSLSDLERVREAFHRFGRRATDPIGTPEVQQLSEEMRGARLRVAHVVNRLADAVEAGSFDTAAIAAQAEHAVTVEIGALATAEARVLGTVQAQLVERANLGRLLGLCSSLNALGDYRRLVSEICRMSAQLTGADRAVVALMEGGRLEVRASMHMSDLSEQPAWREAIEAAVRGPGPLLVEPTSPAGRDDVRLGHGLAAPLGHGEKQLGAVYVDRVLRGGVFTTHDLDLLAIFCAQAATVLENGRVTEELRLALRSRAATLEAISDGVLSLDRRGRVTSVNAVAARILGASAPQTLERLPELAFLRLTLDNGEELDSRVTRLGSGEYLVNARVIRGEGSEVAGCVVTLTEMKRAQSIAQRIVGSPARYSFADLVGESPVLQRCVRLAEAASRSRSTVLITGESGTGKEVLAQAIHNASPRAAGPFVGVNCSAIPRELLESELFGYEAGAFTGAKRNGHPGKFELAEGGTILLDELGEMPLEMQAKLLRVLQERRVHRIGGTREVELDARVIATTNRDLNEEAEKGRFRRDLLFRLKVLHILLPTLGERASDIPLLVEHYLGLFAARLHKSVRAVTPEVMDAFLRYPWPGNIRELENVLEAEVNLAAEGATVLDQVPESLRARAPQAPLPTGPRTLEDTERELLIDALTRNGGSIPDVARQLGISRGTVYNKLRRFSLDPSVYR